MERSVIAEFTNHYLKTVLKRSSTSTATNIRRAMRSLTASWLFVLAASNLVAQTYAPPADGDYGGPGPFAVFVDGFTNSTYPTANGETLVVSVYHPDASINPSLPTIFFAHGYTSPIGVADDYSALLTNLASRGYNVVFSPYEGNGGGASIPKRFDELTTGFNEAVSRFGLNTAQVGFSGHSYGGGFLTSVILHEMMGKASQFRAGHNWGGTAAFFYAMAPGYAYSGGQDTAVTASQTIVFPTNLNVVEQVFKDDTTVADPRVAIDIFYNITTLNSQKEFFTVYGDGHGTPEQVANHFLPNTGTLNTSTSLQAWAIFRHIDALADYTFTGNTNARAIALGNGDPLQTYEGTWSDGTNVVRMGVTDTPSPNAYPGSYVLVDWSSNIANPRSNFPLVSGPPRINSVTLNTGKLLMTATGLLNGHSYVAQTSTNLIGSPWTNAVSFIATQSSQTLTNDIGASRQFWRIYAP